MMRRGFAPERASAGAARRAARPFLARHGFPDQVVEDVLLALSEVATNAAIHAATPFEVTVRVLPECIRVDVTDESPRLPVTSYTPADALSGRGMHIVQALSASCGVDVSGLHKTVWFEIKH